MFRRFAAGAACFLFLAQGCSRFEPHAAREYVYVWPKETYLRDRVAVVSNRIAEVVNGQRLEVVEQGRRFLKVKTDRGEAGWIEERGVIDQKVYDQFTQMAKDHGQDPVVGTATLLDDYWLRDAPGRESDRFYLVAENDKLQLLARASVPKPETAQARPVPRDKAVKAGAPVTPPPPAMEDYWLVRDKEGHVGWVRARTLEEDVPDAIAGLGEGQKIVGAYVLRTVEDPDSSAPGGQVPEYVCVMSAWKDGLPYDFDQVRVFTWNVRKHRYETAYRERNITGFLPVTISKQTFGNQEEPVFSFRVASGDSVALDPTTGMVKPGATVTESYHMEGVIVRRIGAAPPPANGVARNPAGGREKVRKRRRG
ncbi:MAG TPA: SH3 domain-containing protein [Acidobacteriaceae bacterium]|nr:SH3 domain-containing protein [Acidobacteriaceae bacterium]